MPNTLSSGDEIPTNCELIEVHVTELRRLFNPIDPSPPRERDLDSQAEEFILSWARAARRHAPLALKIDVDRPGVPDEVDVVGEAVHNFFGERAASAQRRLSQLLRVGRISLVIGVAFLIIAYLLAGIVDRRLGQTAVSGLIREGMVIGGWVAMWRPLEIFLYDWWPILAERRLNERLRGMPVRVTYTTAASGANASTG
jgi:hypothetical protein